VNEQALSGRALDGFQHRYLIASEHDPAIGMWRKVPDPRVAYSQIIRIINLNLISAGQNDAEGLERLLVHQLSNFI
jgi:hypothetical protein